MMYGLEIEYFTSNKGKVCLPKEIGLGKGSMDECGFLAEVRGTPFNDIRHSIFSLELGIKCMENRINKGSKLIKSMASTKLPKKMLWDCGREYGKGVSKDECIYGEVKMKSNYQTAGLHIHFSSEHIDREGNRYNAFMNLPLIIKQLDGIFSKEIKEANRQMGLYEIKCWGFEYRSLPNTINLSKLTDTIGGLNYGGWG